jgi:hypothetical protein
MKEATSLFFTLLLGVLLFIFFTLLLFRPSDDLPPPGHVYICDQMGKCKEYTGEETTMEVCTLDGKTCLPID